MEEINHYQQSLLKKAIRASQRYHYTLRTLANCGTMAPKGAHILSNGKTSKILGVQMCNNSWSCPCCTAKNLSRYAAKISNAIDALAQKNQSAIMLTFTVFHMKTMSLNETIELLTKTYTLFTKNAKWKRGKYTNGGVWSRFYNYFNIQHFIKGLEVTYGEHGWHPHAHNLYFIPKSKIQDCKKFEKEIFDTWRLTSEKVAKKIFDEEKFKAWKKFSDESDQNCLNQKRPLAGAFFSIDDNGDIATIKSGDYICGWGGDAELTDYGNKKAAEGHYSTTQLRELALEKKEQWALDRYFEFAETMLKRKQHRIDFSRTGLKQVINVYMNTHKYFEKIKKKAISLAAALGGEKFETVCWFSPKLWNEINWIDTISDVPLIYLILQFAKYKNGYDLICELMDVWNLQRPLKSCNIDLAPDLNKACGLAA